MQEPCRSSERALVANREAQRALCRLAKCSARCSVTLPFLSPPWRRVCSDGVNFASRSSPRVITTNGSPLSPPLARCANRSSFRDSRLGSIPALTPFSSDGRRRPRPITKRRCKCQRRASSWSRTKSSGRQRTRDSSLLVLGGRWTGHQGMGSSHYRHAKGRRRLKSRRPRATAQAASRRGASPPARHLSSRLRYSRSVSDRARDRKSRTWWSCENSLYFIRTRYGYSRR